LLRELALDVGVMAAALSVLSTFYLLAILTLLWRWKRRAPQEPSAAREQADGYRPTVAILKPLAGAEPELETNLRSFLRQSYGNFELLMGLADSSDPALPAARSIERESEGLARVVFVGPAAARNRKVSTLAALAKESRASVIVISDSDITVGPGYLHRVIEPLSDPSVGAVTCLYRGSPTSTLWSRLGALWINEWFRPSVLLSRALGSETYCAGSTVAIRRDVLDRIGGFLSLANVLADDNALGARVRELGLSIRLSEYEVKTTVHEPDATALLQHELRWMRTIRAVEPLGHVGYGISLAMPFSLIAALTLGAANRAWLMLPFVTLAIRLALHWMDSSETDRTALARIDADDEAPDALVLGLSAVWLIPFRDLLTFAIWVGSFASRRVTWRHHSLRVQRDGVIVDRKEILPT